MILWWTECKLHPQMFPVQIIFFYTYLCLLELFVPHVLWELVPLLYRSLTCTVSFHFFFTLLTVKAGSRTAPFSFMLFHNRGTKQNVK